MKRILLGIDIGTTGCKTALYEENGAELASSYREYPLHHPLADWAEEDPEDWWRAVAATTRETLAVAGVSAEQVAAVGISCTNGLLAVDREGNPLLPAILMLDQRSAAQAEWIRRTIGEEKVFAITGNRVAPGAYSAPIIRWILQERPELYSRVHKFLVPTGFIVQRLTGNFTIDASRASVTMLFDIRRREWSDELCREMGIDCEKLPQPMESTEIAGYITPQAAEATGLLSGTPVIAGCVDTISAAVGAGAILPGQTFGMLGTVGRVCVVTDGSRFDSRMMNFCHGLPGRCLTVAAVNGTGASLRWFRDTFYRMEAEKAYLENASPYDRMMEEAMQSKPGAAGLLYLPYLLGERTPIWCGDARGVLYGLTLAHGRHDIIRGLLEGVAYAIRHNLEIIQNEYKVSFKHMTLGGGGAKGRLWCEIMGNVTRTDILIPAILETEVLGSALMAGVGVGVYGSFDEAVRKGVRVVDEIQHDQAIAGHYEKSYRAYRKLVEVLLPQFRDFADLGRIADG